MPNRTSAVARALLAIFARRADLILENLVLRQQLADLRRKQPRPRLRASDTKQLREAFPYGQAPRYWILDRDAKYGHEVFTWIHHLGITPKQITARSPWQSGVAERFVGTARRDLLDHVIVPTKSTSSAG